MLHREQKRAMAVLHKLLKLKISFNPRLQEVLFFLRWGHHTVIDILCYLNQSNLTNCKDSKMDVNNERLVISQVGTPWSEYLALGNFIYKVKGVMPQRIFCKIRLHLL